jgi:hypothetical protein
LGKWLGGPTNLQRSQRPSRRFLTKGAGVQSGMHRVLLLWSHICSAGHVLQLRRGAGVQKFATAQWLINGCQSTSTVHIRKWRPSASAKPKVRDNRMNPSTAGNGPIPCSFLQRSIDLETASHYQRLASAVSNPSGRTGWFHRVPQPFAADCTSSHPSSTSDDSCVVGSPDLVQLLW